jgi:hypothetical protein
MRSKPSSTLSASLGRFHYLSTCYYYGCCYSFIIIIMMTQLPGEDKAHMQVCSSSHDFAHMTWRTCKYAPPHMTQLPADALQWSWLESWKQLCLLKQVVCVCMSVCLYVCVSVCLSAWKQLCLLKQVIIVPTTATSPRSCLSLEAGA